MDPNAIITDPMESRPRVWNALEFTPIPACTGAYELGVTTEETGDAEDMVITVVAVWTLVTTVLSATEVLCVAVVVSEI